MEYHGSWSAPISLLWAIPWNFMELGVRQFRWHQQFHGILCNSMELRLGQFRWHERFLGAPISLTRAVPWNSMGFHWTCGVPILLARAVAWNSMLWLKLIRLSRKISWRNISDARVYICNSSLEGRDAKRPPLEITPILATETVLTYNNSTDSFGVACYWDVAKR